MPTALALCGALLVPHKTLDVRHAQEKLWEVGRLFHAEGGAELSSWVEELEELLYKGHVRALLQRLEQELRGGGLHGPGTKGPSKNKFQVVPIRCQFRRTVRGPMV